MSYTKRKSIIKDVEESLGSSGRLRILRFLTKNPEGEIALTRYKLKVLTGIKTKNVNNHLKILVKNGWVEEISLNGVKKYKLNLKERKTELLTDFLQKIGLT